MGFWFDCLVHCLHSTSKNYSRNSIWKISWVMRLEPGAARREMKHNLCAMQRSSNWCYATKTPIFIIEWAYQQYHLGWVRTSVPKEPEMLNGKFLFRKFRPNSEAVWHSVAERLVQPLLQLGLQGQRPSRDLHQRVAGRLCPAPRSVLVIVF